ERAIYRGQIKSRADGKSFRGKPLMRRVPEPPEAAGPGDQHTDKFIRPGTHGFQHGTALCDPARRVEVARGQVGHIQRDAAILAGAFREKVEVVLKLCEMVLAEAVMAALINALRGCNIPDIVKDRPAGVGGDSDRLAGKCQLRRDLRQAGRREYAVKSTIHEGQRELQIVTDIHSSR